MAITRAQQAKQLLAQGGRTGFQGGGADAGTRSFAESQGRSKAEVDQLGRDFGFSGAEVAGDSGRQRPDDTSQSTVIIPKKKPPITKENYQKPKKFVTPILAFADLIGSKISGSKLAMLNNAMQRNNYLATLTPEEQVEALQDLAAIGIGTTNPMGIDRNIERFDTKDDPAANPVQQREVAELVPEQPTPPAPPTRDEKIKTMQERIDAMPNSVPVRRTPSPPPAEPPKLADLPGRDVKPTGAPNLADLPRTPYRNPNEILGGGSGELTPATRQEGVVPDLTRTTEYGSKYNPTLVDRYTHTRNQPQMSGKELLQGTGIAKPVDQGGKDWQDMVENLNYAPMQTMQPNENPIEAAMRTLDQRRGNVGQTTSLGQGATITRRPAGATSKTTPNWTSLRNQNDGMSLSDANRNFASFQDTLLYGRRHNIVEVLPLLDNLLL